MMFGARNVVAGSSFVFRDFLGGPISGAVITASSEYSTSYPASEAFDGAGDRPGVASEYSNRWASASGQFSGTTPVNSGLPWWQINFGSIEKLYGIKFYVSIHGISSCNIYGSSTGAFSGEQVLLSTIAGITEHNSVNTVLASDNYTFTNPGEYQYVRLVVTSKYAHSTATYCTINEIYFMRYV